MSILLDCSSKHLTSCSQQISWLQDNSQQFIMSAAIKILWVLKIAVKANLHYRMARNFWGIQFLRKAHLQRFRDLIFADGHSRVAPPTISVRLHLLLQAHRGSNLIGIGEKKQQAIDRSYLYLAEIEKWHKSSIWSRLEHLCRSSTIIMNWCEVNQLG